MTGDYETKYYFQRSLYGFALIIMVIIAAVFAWLWWQERSSSTLQTADDTSSEMRQDQKAACPESFAVYKNSDLSLEFCYPKLWGEVKAEKIGNSSLRDTEGYTGAGHRLKFSFSNRTAGEDDSPQKHPVIGLSIPTNDWEVPPADSRCGYPPPHNISQWRQGLDAGSQGTTQERFIERDIITQTDAYQIKERVSEGGAQSGVCMTGVKALGGEQYQAATAAYLVAFNDDVTNAGEHINSPGTLLPAQVRDNFEIFVKSIKLTNAPASPAPLEVQPAN